MWSPIELVSIMDLLDHLHVTWLKIERTIGFPTAKEILGKRFNEMFVNVVNLECLAAAFIGYRFPIPLIKGTHSDMSNKNLHLWLTAAPFISAGGMFAFAAYVWQCAPYLAPDQKSESAPSASIAQTLPLLSVSMR